jgi:hypothetical protein
LQGSKRLDERSDENSTTCTFIHTTNFAALYTPYQSEKPEGPELNILTYICCSISILGLLVTIGVHLALPRLRKTANRRILINLCFAVLGRDITIITVGLTGTGPLSKLCKQVAMDVYPDYEPDDLIRFIDHYIFNKEDVGRDELLTCPELVVVAALTQYFMIATIGWMACEGKCQKPCLYRSYFI